MPVTWPNRGSSERPVGTCRSMAGRVVQALPVVLLLLSLVATALLYRQQQQTLDARQRAQFTQQAGRFESALTTRLLRYEDAVRGAQALLAANPATDRAAFRRYVATLDLPHHYPGINGLGVISYVPRARLAAFESAARADGAPAYRVWPAGRRAVYFPIRYVEPLSPNRRALGYDVGTESLRRTAAERACDTGLPARTAKITLVQDATRSPGFLLILPLYRGGVNPGTVAARRAALVGWVYAPVRVPALVQGLIGPRNAGLEVAIFDGTRPTPATLLYGKATRSTPAGALVQTARLNLAGSAWTLRVTAQPAFDAALGPDQPLLILLAGAGFSVLLGALALLLVTGRARALALATRMTASLRTSEERFRALSEHGSDLVCILGLPDGGVRYESPSYRRVLGARLADLQREAGSPLGVVHPEDRPRVRAAFAAITESGAPTARLDFRHRHADGSWRTLESICTNRLNDPAIGGIVVTSRDITERARAAAQVRAVYEAMACGVMVVDASGVVTEANTEAEHLLGTPRAALRGHTLAEVTGPSVKEDGASLPVEERPVGRALATGRPVRGVAFGLRQRDGDLLWIQADAVPLFDDDEAVRQVVVSFVDITERARAEELRRVEMERLAGVIATQQEVALAGLDTHVVLPLIAARAQELTGADGAVVELVEGEELVYHAVSGTMEGFLGTRLPLAGTLSGLAVQSGEALSCDDAATDPRTNPEVCRRLGIGSMIVVPLRHGGTVAGVLKVSAVAAHAFDMRAVQTLQLMAGVLGAALGQATAFAALCASEERLRTVVANAPLILFTLDPDGIYTMSDGAGLAALGREPGAVVGRSVFDVYRNHPDLLDYTRQALAGTPVTFPSRVGDASFDNHLAPLYDEQGRITSVVGVATNITERARAEAALEESRRELERSNAELQQFAYVASHDLQEPLRTITSYLKLLQRRYQGKLGEDADEFIGFATDGSQRMSALIKAVLDYSRVGTRGKDFAPADCQALVAAVVANLDARIAETGARVTHAGLPAVLGDDAQLGQLFQNLIGNALKFCRDTPEVTISAERQGDVWLMRVRDNGIGIAPEQAERIFQMFQRLHTRAEYEGTGIGLSVCKRIVERHGGRIWVESEPGQGATFLFTLPACDAAERSAA